MFFESLVEFGKDLLNQQPLIRVNFHSCLKRNNSYKQPTQKRVWALYQNFSLLFTHILPKSIRYIWTDLMVICGYAWLSETVSAEKLYKLHNFHVIRFFKAGYRFFF